MFKSLFREHRRALAVDGLIAPGAFADPVFDRFVTAAASAFVAPISALSLIHGNEQTVKASHGVTLDCLPRSDGFCSFVLDSPEVLECCDPQADPRFSGLPGVVGDPHVRYYIGASLRLLSGIDVGALCVLDTVHRPPASDDQRAYLLGLARQASMMLESRLGQWGHAA